MPLIGRVRVSLTEVPHFRLLVDFVADVEHYADEECDVALQALVHDLRDALLSVWEEED